MANELTYQSIFPGEQIDARLTAVASLQEALAAVEQAITAKYTKPASGIPETDLDEAVQSALAKARSAVQDLSNYYTKTEIDALLSAVNSQQYVDVTALPTAGADTLDKIYLVGPDANNQYARYYTSYDGSAYSWVAAGTTEINLALYATKAELSQLSQKVTEVEDIISPVTAQAALTFTAGYVINSSGQIVAQQTNFAVSDQVSLSGVKAVIISTRCGYGNLLYAFYASDDSFISGLQGATSGYTTLTDEKVEVPNGASYMVVAIDNVASASSLVLITGYELSNQSQVDDNTEKINGLNMVADLVDISFEAQTKKYITNQGAITDIDNSDYVLSGFVDIEGIDSVIISASGNWDNGLYAFYDESQSLVQIGERAAPSREYTVLRDETVSVPAAAKYIVVAGRGGQVVPAIAYNAGYKLPGDWLGKKWIAIGDSLTAVNATSISKYHDYIKSETGITVVNMGVSGTGYMRGAESSNAFYQRVNNIATDGDVITIFGSFNDLGSTFTLGEPTDTGTSTICGCINTTLDLILSKYMAAGKIPSIGVITPTPWKGRTPASPTSISAQYVDALIECCKLKSIPVLDLWRCSNLHPDDATFRTLAYSHDGDSGVHPDENGHKIFAPMIKEFIAGLLA